MDTYFTRARPPRLPEALLSGEWLCACTEGEFSVCNAYGDGATITMIADMAMIERRR